MKTFKKFVVAATTATMIFGMVGSAFAAVNVGGTAFADVDADDDAATAFNVLAALGVYEGNEGVGGNVRPDSTITREEFAAVVVRFLDKEGTASSLNTYVPNFTDASSISSWAWGYVNVAASLGIINGYPNGEFRPKNPVTHAEVLAMLTRAVNVDKAATGVWPLNYVVLGSSVGIDDDVDIVANVPATRGEVAIMTYNAYSVDQEWDSDKEELVDRAGTFGSEQTDNSFEATVDSVTSSKISVTGKAGFGDYDGTYDWAEDAWVNGVDKLNDLVDLDVKVFINDDDEVVAVVVDEDDVTIATGEIDPDDLEDGRFIVDGERYRDISDDIVVYLNNIEVADSTAIKGEAELVDYLWDEVIPHNSANNNIDDFVVDVTASVTVNDDDEVISVRLLAWNYDGYALDGYDEDDETITVDTDVIDITKDTIITINGDSATFSELVEAVDEFVDEYEEDPLVYVATEAGEDNGEAYRIALFTETVTGDVVASGKDGDDDYIVLDVDGDEMDIVLNGDYDGRGGAFYDGTLPSGKTTVLLDIEGDGAAILESSSEVGDFYALFTRYRADDDDEVESVTLKNSDGENVVYDVYKDGEADEFGLDTAGSGYKKIVYVSLDGNDIELVTRVQYDAASTNISNAADLTAAGSDGVENDVDIESVTSSYIKAGGEVLPYADGGVVVFDATDGDKQIKVDNLKKNWTISYALDSEGAVGLIIVTGK